METKLIVKGLIGEKYIAEKITQLGYRVLYVGGCQLYSTTGNRFYMVDLAVFGKGETLWVQAKNKEPRKFYSDTGMELWRYKALIEHQKESGLKVLVLFTDSSGQIYGEWLDNLQKCLSPYGGLINKQTGNVMIYWLCSALKDYHELLT